MNIISKIPLLIAILALFNAPHLRANPATNSPKIYTLYHNAVLLNPATQQRIDNGWLLIENGKIVRIGQVADPEQPLPAAQHRIDLQKQFVLPGLIDVHLHLTAGPHRVEMIDNNPVLSVASVPDITRYHAISTLASGITTAFSPAGDPQANALYAKNQRTGKWRGPTLHYAGLVFDPMPIIGGSIYPNNEAQWRAEINRQKNLGASHIKLYSGLSESEVAMGIKLAHEAGLKTIGHLDDKVSWQYAALQGIDMLTHALPTSAELLTGKQQLVYQKQRENPMDQRFLYRWFQYANFDSEPMQTLFSTLAKKQIRVDLTMVVNELFYFSNNLDKLYTDDSLWVFHPQTRNKWEALMAAPSYDWSEQDFADAQHQMPKVKALFKRLYDAEVALAIGTDSVSSGPFFLRELQLSKQAAGLSNWELLAMATINGARHLNLNNVGQLAPGFTADFIVLPANPLINIDALSDIWLVIQAGEEHSVDALKAELAEFSAASL